MMILRRPVSSPGRVDKYPPPLMGFLRSKSNNNRGSTSRSRSRSKGRSKASPLFVRRNKSAAAVTQEPSSPKVTCMGQVRIKPKKIKPDEDPTRKKCEWIRKFSDRIKTMSFRPNWKWSSCSCSCRNQSKDSPTRTDFPTRTESVQEIEKDEEEGEDFKIPEVIVSPVSSTPPIDAFLLTRSRSAPYGSSSLAYRFWEENKQREEEEEARKVKSEVFESPTEELGFERRPELTRSKSEPARIGEMKIGVCF